MTPAPRTDLEPEPGDFDADLATIDPRLVEVHRGDPDAKVRIVVSIDGEDARRLQRLSAARGEKPAGLIAELLREAEGTPPVPLGSARRVPPDPQSNPLPLESDCRSWLRGMYCAGLTTAKVRRDGADQG